MRFVFVRQVRQHGIGVCPPPVPLEPRQRGGRTPLSHSPYTLPTSPPPSSKLHPLPPSVHPLRPHSPWDSLCPSDIVCGVAGLGATPALVQPTRTFLMAEGVGMNRQES